MTTSTTFSHTNAETTRREDLMVIAFSVWTILGLFLDGYAHENFRELESFFTPWHGVFYSGFAATALAMMWIITRRSDPNRSWSAAIPPGYGLGMVGLGLFAMGGVGDALWHTFFGVEVTIDALLSPTHVMLFTGELLVLTSALRKPSILGTARPRWGEIAVPLTALVLAVSLVAFFFVYLWGPGVTWVFQLPFDSVTEEGEIAVMAGVGAALTATAILVWPVLWLARRTRTPFGTITVLLVVVNLLIVAAFDRDPVAIAAGLLSGLVGDAIMLLVDSPRWRARALGGAIPLVLWSTVFAVLAAGGGIVWQPELWGGVIVFTTLQGLALAALAGNPSPVPGLPQPRPLVRSKLP